MGVSLKIPFQLTKILQKCLCEKVSQVSYKKRNSIGSEALLVTCIFLLRDPSVGPFCMHLAKLNGHIYCRYIVTICCPSLIARFMGPTWGPSGADRTQVGHMLVPWFWDDTVIVRRAGLLWSQQDFEWRWSVPLFKCLTVLEFSFILFDLCLLITFFNFIMNYVPIVTFWIFTYHKIWILSIMFCFIWSYWIIYFLACLEVSWRVVS